MADVSSPDDGSNGIGQTISDLASSAADAFKSYTAGQTATQTAATNQGTYMVLGLIVLAIVVIPQLLKG